MHRAETIEDVGDIVANICQDIDAKSALRSGHDVLDEAQIDSALGRTGLDLQNLNLRDRFTEEERTEKRAQHRKEVFRTDVGITRRRLRHRRNRHISHSPQKGRIPTNIARSACPRRSYQKRANPTISRRTFPPRTRRHPHRQSTRRHEPHLRPLPNRRHRSHNRSRHPRPHRDPHRPGGLNSAFGCCVQLRHSDESRNPEGHMRLGVYPTSSPLMPKGEQFVIPSVARNLFLRSNGRRLEG